MSLDETTCDDFLGGRVKLRQPVHGYRAGIDPVLLAASVPAKPGQAILELGCGAGAASLCLAARVNDLDLTGVELQPLYAALCRQNAVANKSSMNVVEADLMSLPADLRNRSFDHVIMNPPYYDRTASTSSSDSGRDIALGGDTPLAEWIKTGAKRLAPNGHLSLIQRIDRLPEALSAVQNLLGSIVLLPISARTQREAGLFILQARKSGRAGFRLKPALILHEGEQHISDRPSYTDEVSAILRLGSALNIN